MFYEILKQEPNNDKTCPQSIKEKDSEITD